MAELAYILSPSYSGSTLLTFLLARHPQIATVGELKATRFGSDINEYPCSCGCLFLECPFWRKVEERMRQKERDFSLRGFETYFRASGDKLADLLLRVSVRNGLFEKARHLWLASWPPATRALREIASQNLAFIDTVTEMQKAQVFLDSSKEAVRLLHFRRATDLDIRVIQLVRDGRGFVNSFRNHTQSSIRTAAREWVHTQQECRRVLGAFRADQRIRIRYEDICSDTQGAIRRLHEFLGLSAMEDPLENTTTELHILGNKMRLQPLREIKLDEKWRSALSPRDLADFERVAGNMNREFGYDAD